MTMLRFARHGYEPDRRQDFAFEAGFGSGDPDQVLVLEQRKGDITDKSGCPDSTSMSIYFCYAPFPSSPPFSVCVRPRPSPRPAQVPGMNARALACIRSVGVEKPIVSEVDYGPDRSDES
jgi:hypothetical protein